MQTSARLKDGLCVGAPADPDVVEEARRLSFKGTAALGGAELSLRSRTACASIPPVMGQRMTWRQKDVGTSLKSRHCCNTAQECSPCQESRADKKPTGAGTVD